MVRRLVIVRFPMGTVRDHIARLSAGADHDPHAVLGAHVRGDRVTIRTWQPGASAVAVLTDRGVASMERVDGDLWAVVLRRRRPPGYRLVVDRGGEPEVIEDPYRFLPTLGELDLHLITEGRHLRLWEALGARALDLDGVAGVAFTVWAPSAGGVAVAGDFNGWDRRRHPMRSLGSSGVWELFVPGAEGGQHYKYAITAADGRVLERADPLAQAAEPPPATASRVARSSYAWGDDAWLARRASAQSVAAPIAVYEVHLASWRRGLSYRDLAEQLPAYVASLGYTHVELMPVMQHPFAGSWGYQVSGYYAPDSRLGSPDDLRHLIDRLHQAGIGVLLDWVPGHFPRDEFALARFDGTALYEHEDPRRGAHPDWGTLVFNYGRNEVRNFLVANALYWIEEFHADGLRVDAVASMLYLDYSRAAGEWLPNEYGGNENLEAIAFLRELNTEVYGRHPDVMMVAEESTAWPGVSRPVHDGGLGFGFKWNMGFMHDTLSYFGRQPVHRRHHHDDLTKPMLYAYSENYVLPVSHDEVVHGKGSLYGRMPGDDWQKRANVRAYLAWMWAHPGKKLLFMGCELAQRAEWNHDAELDWAAADGGIARLVGDLNRLLVEHPALHATDTDPGGFRWIDVAAADENAATFVRSAGDDLIVCAANLSPVPRTAFRLRLPVAGTWRELMNTDAGVYGGSGMGNAGRVTAGDDATVVLPPLSVVYFAPMRS
jgi:1,4-alpha-glucan branching enzyme